MQSSFFQQTTAPITATLAGWAPKCNAEMEKRVRLDIEIPLTPELIALAPVSIQSAATAIGNLEGGMTQGQISSEYDQTIELYATPDHTTPLLTLSNVKVSNICVFRPTPKEGPSSDLFLTFSVNVKAETPFGGHLVTWALENLRATIFLRGFDVQGSLALTDAEPAPKPARAGKSKGGKDAAANDTVN